MNGAHGGAYRPGLTAAVRDAAGHPAGEHVLVAGGHEPARARVEVTSGETVSVTVRVGVSPVPATQPAAAPAPEDAQPGRESGAKGGPAGAPGAGPGDSQAGWADFDGMTSRLGTERSGE